MMYLITTLMTIMPTTMTFDRYENVVAQTDGH